MQIQIVTSLGSIFVGRHMVGKFIFRTISSQLALNKSFASEFQFSEL